MEESSEKLVEKYEEGISALEIGKLEQAKNNFEEVITEDKNFVPAYNKMAVIAFYEKDLDKAEKWLKDAEEFDENFAPVITNLGSLAKKRGNANKARELYEKAININPDYGPAYNNLGVICREQGDFGESVKHLKKARKLGSYSVKITDEPIYKRKGCLIPVVLVTFFTLLIYFWLK